MKAIQQTLLLLALALLATGIQAQTQDISQILNQNKGKLGLTDQDLAEYRVSSDYTTDHLGIRHIYLQQSYGDIPVYSGILNLNVAGDRIVSFGNQWVPSLAQLGPDAIPVITARSALEAAAVHLEKTFTGVQELSTELNTLGRIAEVTYSPGTLSQEEIPVTLTWLPGAEKDVHLCWMVLIYQTDAEDVWEIFIDAKTGMYHRKENLTRHCAFDKDHYLPSPGATSTLALPLPVVPDSSYRVFPMPIESPNHGSRAVVTKPWQDAGPGNAATTLGWHDTDTIQYTITRGNNVHAYADLNNMGSGPSPDTSDLRFDYPFDPMLDPADNWEAAITNLFYWNNIIHDVMYQYGFNEASGNFQVNNLGRGGLGNDYVRAEGLDGGGSNNANFSTPVDGLRPRMQMYLWSQVSATSPLTINSPAAIAGEMWAVESDFSNNNHLADVGPVTGDLIYVIDVGDTTHIACTPLSNAGSISGKVAVIDRGECDFTAKVKRVQDLGAIAAIVVNNVAGAPFGMGGNNNTIVIPAVMVSLADGDILKASMDTSTVNITLEAVDGIIPDGDYDSGIITHEYGHGISTRLTGGPGNSSCLNNSEQMGEGWSDFFGLMLTTDWTTAAPTDLRGIGTYVLGEPTNGTGIRTYPYTTDMDVNPFTYASIGSSGGSVHYIGSVWCTMLWDMTWKIIESNPADPDIYHGTGGNNIALQLVIDGLKLQPCGPGFVDGRDAILLADQLRYGGAHQCAIWEAFAGRGLGVSASQGSPNSYLDGSQSFDVPDGVFIHSFSDTTAVTEGKEVTFYLGVIGSCSGHNDLVIQDVLSPDLIYIPGSGGTLQGDTVTFLADTLGVLDTLTFSYRGYIRPCSASEASVLSEETVETTTQYQSIKLGGNGVKEWVISSAQSASPTHAWYAQDYSNPSDFALTLINPLVVQGALLIDFDHRYETEATYDGGVVEYSLNNGSTWIDAGPFFTANGYTQIINPGTNSALAGREAFAGDSDTQFDTVGFVHSQILLNVGSTPNFKVRFRFATDGSVGGPGLNGWYVDNLVISQLSGLTNETLVSDPDGILENQFYTTLTAPFAGSMIFVDSTSAGDQGGSTWADAIHHLPFALALAGCRPVDTVLVAEGTYVPSLDDDRGDAMALSGTAFIFGGFPAGGSVFALRDPATYQTILSGDIGSSGDTTDNSYHVVTADSAASNTLLDGVVIKDGNASGAGDQGMGAAVFCEGRLTLHDILVHGHHAAGDGEVIVIRGTNALLHLDDCTISGSGGNLAKLLNLQSAQVTISGNTIFLPE